MAEAEVEYQEHTSPSIYIKFALERNTLEALGVNEEASVVIWTTTPWTLPANLAVALHPDFNYVLVKTSSGNLILASGLLENFTQKLAIQNYQVVKTLAWAISSGKQNRKKGTGG